MSSWPRRIEEGYDPNKPDASPFRGYRFRILTAQGPAAPGGKKSYLVNGDMTGGFALLAYPAKYASSGVMTFMVGPNGVVYQKDLGQDTATLAPRWWSSTRTTRGPQCRRPDL